MKAQTANLSRADEDYARLARLPNSVWMNALRAIASLKLTVALLAMGIFIVLAGTLAQAYKDVWLVIGDYFRIDFHQLVNGEFPWIHPSELFAWIDLQIFFPPSFFPSHPQVPGGFFFPKGWTIGVLLGLNLLAAHAIRFRIQARGKRLLYGLVVTAVGALITWLVIETGSSRQGFQDTSLLGTSTIWLLFKYGIAAVWLAVLAAILSTSKEEKAKRWILTVAAVALGALVLWIFIRGNAARLGDSSMRILWQLLKGGLAGCVLLIGCILLFKKRAGVVLLHAGVGLLMISELLAGVGAEEAQMVIREGETVNYASDIRSLELAIIDRSPAEYDKVAVVSEKTLLRHLGKQSEPIRSDALPFDIRVEQFFRNSQLRNASQDEPNPATAGEGKRLVADEVRPVSATDRMSGINMPSGYVTLLEKGTGKPLGTYLVSVYLQPQEVKVGQKTYYIALRHRRIYKPFTIHLKDVRKVDYIGTSIPKDYSSIVRLVENEQTRKHLSPLFTRGSTRNVDRTVRIWMNNPLRYAGETFYQSGYSKDPRTGIETTTLQVVVNPSWMMPYVACMIVSIGMLAHFWMVLVRFLNRVSKENSSTLPAHERPKKQSERNKRRRTPSLSLGAAAVRANRTGWLVPLIIVVVWGGWALSHAVPPRYGQNELNLYEFGKLPMVFEGRIKPFDTFARNSLLIISDRQTFKDTEGRRQPAIRWLLDVICHPEKADKYRVVRIQNLELLDVLGLKRRSGFRYSIEEIRPKLQEFEKQLQLALRTEPERRSLFQRKVVELRQRLGRYSLILAAFRRPSLPEPPDLTSEEKDKQTLTEDLRKFRHAYDIVRMQNKQLAQGQPPLAVPVVIQDSREQIPESIRDWLDKRRPWETYPEAVTNDLVRTKLFHLPANPPTTYLQNILLAYEKGDVQAFNDQVKAYESTLANTSKLKLNLRKVAFEAFFNHFSPFYYASILYLIAFLLTALSWLGWQQKVLNRSAFWLVVFTFFIHTFAVAGRVYISGRPPVTNLYSSAVFVGWAAVLIGIVLESIFRQGLGNVVASVVGFGTLLIAHMLAGDGDTFTVLQAVLDTQFWLTTHVLTITLGYAATFVAGVLGLYYVLAGVLTSALAPNTAKRLSRMIYGTVCFAIFFSLIGTVLGGLWADDSWGRFWGWDPKENGALIIVLWNALVLHALWGRMVRDRGLAVLAIGGNIVTSWSWFGVNELGIGLHSYGFTEGVLQALFLFVLTQLIVIGLGLLPIEYWRSYRRHSSSEKLA